MVGAISSKSFTPTLVRSSDLSAVQSSMEKGGDRDHIGGLIERLIQRLTDFCGGTNYSEVRRCAFDLYSTETSDRQKFQAFEKIQFLAGDGFEGRFSIEESPENPGKAFLAIELEDGEIQRFEISKRELFFDKWDVEFNQAAIQGDLALLEKEPLDEKQWQKDVERTGVRICGKLVRSDSDFNALAQSYKFSDEEVIFAKKFCVQTVNAIIWNRAIDGVQINSSVSEKDLRLSYEMSRNADGRLNIDAVVEFDKSEQNSVNEMIEYMEDALPSEKGLTTQIGNPIIHVREAALNLNIQFSPGEPLITHLSGHIGQYVGPVEPLPEPRLQMDPGLMPGMKA